MNIFFRELAQHELDDFRKDVLKVFSIAIEELFGPARAGESFDDMIPAETLADSL